MRLASKAICSGVRAKRLAVAAGITSSDVINRIPTTFIAMAISRAIINIKADRTAVTGIPSTLASSSWIVIDRSGLQRNIINKIDAEPIL